jgi:hypothetical protein
VRSTAESWPQAEDDLVAQPSDLLLDCSFAEENAAGFALGALNVDEQLRFVQHLSWCPNCARLLHEERKTVGYLAFLSPQAVPPESAKRTLFDRINADQQLKSATFETPTSIVLPSTVTLELLDSPLGHTIASDIAPSKQKLGKRRFTWELAAAPLAAVPLVVALALVGGWALNTQNRLDRQSAQARVLEDQNAQLAAQISQLSSGLENSQVRKFDMDSSDSVGGGAGGSVVTLADQTWTNLSVWSMPPSSSGYEVLVESKSGQMQQAASFTVDDKGDASVRLNISTPLAQFKAVHVQKLSTAGPSSADDSDGQHDVLWTDFDSNLGGQSGTDANAKAN